MTIDPLKSPAIAYMMEMTLWSQASRSVVVASGMGIEEGMIGLEPGDAQRFRVTMAKTRANPVSVWRGFDVRHIAMQTKDNINFRQFDVLAALDAASQYLDQSTLDFITLRDVRDAKLEIALTPETELMDWFEADTEMVQLAMAFRQQMINDAQPHRHQIAAGAYVMQREPLRQLDKLMIYDTLRLLILPAGIAGAVVVGNLYVPFWWSPELDTNTIQVWARAEIRFAFDVLMAAIWRDACIVREQALTSSPSHGRGYNARGVKSDVVRFPRTIYKAQWGSAQDREAADAIAKRAHAVRGHYRELSPGRTASEQAADTAQEYGYPPPPAGYTFVRPHTRGEGEAMPQVRRVVCRGLQVAKTVLG